MLLEVLDNLLHVALEVISEGLLVPETCLHQTMVENDINAGHAPLFSSFVKFFSRSVGSSKNNLAFLAGFVLRNNKNKIKTAPKLSRDQNSGVLWWSLSVKKWGIWKLQHFILRWFLHVTSEYSTVRCPVFRWTKIVEPCSSYNGQVIKMRMTLDRQFLGCSYTWQKLSISNSQKFLKYWPKTIFKTLED